MVPKLTYRKNRKKEIKMDNDTKTNLKEDINDAQIYANITAKTLANIASEIYEEIKDLTESAESVSIKVGNNKPLSFKIDSFKVDEIAKIAKSE